MMSISLQLCACIESYDRKKRSSSYPTQSSLLLLLALPDEVHGNLAEAGKRALVDAQHLAEFLRAGKGGVVARLNSTLVRAGLALPHRPGQQGLGGSGHAEHHGQKSRREKDAHVCLVA